MDRREAELRAARIALAEECVRFIAEHRELDRRITAERTALRDLAAGNAHVAQIAREDPGSPCVRLMALATLEAAAQLEAEIQQGLAELEVRRDRLHHDHTVLVARRNALEAEIAAATTGASRDRLLALA